MYTVVEVGNCSDSDSELNKQKCKINVTIKIL